jgi:hypothetical protein
MSGDLGYIVEIEHFHAKIGALYASAIRRRSSTFASDTIEAWIFGDVAAVGLLR